MMHVPTMRYDAHPRVARSVVARVLCYPARPIVATTRVSADRGRDSVIFKIVPRPCFSTLFKLKNLEILKRQREDRIDSLIITGV